MNKFLLGLTLALLAAWAEAKAFTEGHALIFIYESHCPYCQQMAPVVKAYSEETGLLVSPVSIDQRPIAPFDYFDIPKPELLQTVFANQAVEYPALFLLNLKTKALYPVSIGALSLDELHERMGVLITKIARFEQGEA